MGFDTARTTGIDIGSAAPRTLISSARVQGFQIGAAASYVGLSPARISFSWVRRLPLVPAAIDEDLDHRLPFEQLREEVLDLRAARERLGVLSAIPRVDPEEIPVVLRVQEHVMRQVPGLPRHILGRAGHLVVELLRRLRVTLEPRANRDGHLHLNVLLESDWFGLSQGLLAGQPSDPVDLLRMLLDRLHQRVLVSRFEAPSTVALSAFAQASGRPGLTHGRHGRRRLLAKLWSASEDLRVRFGELYPVTGSSNQAAEPQPYIAVMS